MVRPHDRLTVKLVFVVVLLFIRKLSPGFYFRETLHMRSFVKRKSSQNAEITLSFNDICKSCHSREFLASQMCLLTLFANIKFSRIYSIV